MIVLLKFQLNNHMVIIYAQKDILGFPVMIVINTQNSGQINTLIQHNIVARDVM